MGNKNEPKLDEEDIQLLKAIARHGFVDIQYVLKFYRLGCKERTVRERVKQLAKHHYLYEEKMFIPPAYTMSQKTGYVAYCLGREGLAYMRFMGEEVPNYQATLTKAAPYRIYHQVQVATVCDSIEEAFRKREKGIYVVDSILNEKEATLSDQSNQPDAIILFKSKTNNHHGVLAIFVELERSYARWQRIDAKLEAYYKNFSLNKYAEELKIPIVAHRLLFVSQTDMQFNTLLRKIELCSNVDKIEILIAQYSDVCINSTTPIYKTPKNQNTFSLLSVLKKEEDKGDK